MEKKKKKKKKKKAIIRVLGRFIEKEKNYI